MFDGMLHKPGLVRDALSDAALADARQRCDDAYRAMCWRASEGWRSVPLLPAVHDAQEARARYIDQISNAWKQPTIRRDLRRDQSALGGFRPNETTASQRRGARPPDDDDGDGDDLDYTSGPDDVDPYAGSVWSAQNAIENGGPDSADQNEAYMRRMSGYQPGATGSSVRAERARYRPRDSASSQSIRDQAYAEMVERLGSAWRRP
jgi:hypothetical protein